MRKLFFAMLFGLSCLCSHQASAQKKITLEDLKNLDIGSILGKNSLLKVKRDLVQNLALVIIK